MRTAKEMAIITNIFHLKAKMKARKEEQVNRLLRLLDERCTEKAQQGENKYDLGYSCDSNLPINEVVIKLRELGYRVIFCSDSASSYINIHWQE